jgi:hypothetical protein
MNVIKTPTPTISILCEKKIMSMPIKDKSIATSKEFFLPTFSVKKEKISIPISAPRNGSDCMAVSS